MKKKLWTPRFGIRENMSRTCYTAPIKFRRITITKCTKMQSYVCNFIAFAKCDSGHRQQFFGIPQFGQNFVRGADANRIQSSRISKFLQSCAK